jgi:hypothetical protein
MAFIPEKEAKGIENYRTKLNKVLEGKRVTTMLHEDIIRELDASAKLFNILIIKTNLAIPYTSVFFQLKCGYWNGDSEDELRKALAKGKSATSIKLNLNNKSVNATMKKVGGKTIVLFDRVNLVKNDMISITIKL